ncbi:MAG: trypsin-like serine protease [Polyangiaceae bacterium]|nr:trypsin-like serine protease [Polyangiaceae bacterium]
MAASLCPRRTRGSHFRLVVTVLAMVTAACGAPASSPEHVGAEQSAVQGGTSDTTDNFVVGVVNHTSNQEVAVCTGSLLAPNLVATARHCVAGISSAVVECTSTMFGDVTAPGNVYVSNDAVLSSSDYHQVSKIIVPSGANAAGFCGNDLALLLLSDSFSLPAYVTPVIDPPMTDRAAYSSTITVIGYGIDTPTDTMGTTAGTRRIHQNIDLVCIVDPTNDASFLDCPNNSMVAQVIGNNEFETLGSTCDGDSGSGAFEQRNFNAGKAVSFGVLSRGGVSADGSTCESGIYTRFDAWGSLLASAAVEAAQMGGYDPPAWAGASTQSDGGSCLAESSPCNGNGDCCANNCLSHDNGATFVCAACDTDNPCDTGLSCQQGTCVPFAETDSGASDVTHGAAPASAAPATKSSKGGCAVANGPGETPGRDTPSWPLGIAVVAASALARRRGRWCAN